MSPYHWIEWDLTCSDTKLNLQGNNGLTHATMAYRQVDSHEELIHFS
jgi:hypothetical protein